MPEGGYSVIRLGKFLENVLFLMISLSHTTGYRQIMQVTGVPPQPEKKYLGDVLRR
jgi:hypothetical protein